MKISRLAAFILGLVVTAALPTFAQTFGAEKRLYPHAVASISQNPTVYAFGNNVYIAWSTYSSATGHADVFVATSTDNGSTFPNPPVNVSNQAGPDIQPVIAGDGTNVHVFWTDDLSGENPLGGNANIGRIFYARSTNNGASFGGVQTLVSQPGYSRPTSALVKGAEVHLVFYDNRIMTNAALAGRVYHMMSCNSGANWGAETHVTRFDGEVDGENPRLAMLTGGEVFLTYRTSRGGIPQDGHPPFQINLLRMAAGCPTAAWFYPAQRLSAGSQVELGGNYGPNIFPGLSGGLHAAWWSDTAGTNLMYRHGKPNEAGFGPQTDLSGFGLNHLQWTGVAEHTGFGIGEDSSGRVHAIFLENSSTRVNFQTGNIWYRCSPTAGGAFVAKQLATGALATEPRAVLTNNRLHMVWMDFRNTVNDQAEIYYNFVSTTGCSPPAPSTPPTPSTGTMNFGGNSIQTTSSGQSLQLTNNGAGNLIITNITASAGFGVASHNCATVAPAASCTVSVTFTPPTQGTVNGTLTVTYSGGTTTVNLTGVGELSLVKHFYRSILNRAPEPGGQEFWEAEAARLTGLGANINEVWFVMANYFFNSPEYIAANKTNTAFLIDVYYTFFNRSPDQGGFDFWMSQMNAGLSREGVTFWFMFSPEFRSFTEGIFGNAAARPEVDMVMDLFRGILNRFPDTPAFNAFVGQLRSAQCQSPGAVYTAVNDMSYFFLFGSAEYANRARTNTQFVSDMYNAFLRRGGAASEVAFWINQLNTAAKDRNTERSDFIASGEFGARVNAVINAGCIP